jgi:hypothetical protein
MRPIIRVLPWASWSDHDFFDTHMLDLLPKGRAINAVAIPQEIPWRLVPRKRLHHLLRSPLGGGVLGDGKMDDPSAMMGHDEQDEQHLVRHRRYHKEIQGHQVLHVIGEKGLPRRRLPRPHPIRLHRGFDHVNAQLAQLADDPWCTPGRIGLPRPADEIADVFGNPWTAGRTLLAQLSPMVAKALALPSDDGAQLDERQGALSA